MQRASGKRNQKSEGKGQGACPIAAAHARQEELIREALEKQPQDTNLLQQAGRLMPALLEHVESKVAQEKEARVALEHQQLLEEEAAERSKVEEEEKAKEEEKR